ncbi:Metallo-dependent phosphatase-like protein [Gongronella butleri]|nr:Metallo-dependent phosphatase-like protein [Gongronella butleri]
MNLTGATWTYVVVTLLCLLRATYLSYVSSGPLFPTPSVPDLPNTPVPSLNDAQQINDTQDNLFYFVQVSDLHISKYYYYTQHFVQFIHSVLPLLSPKFVVVTGDLTDAKDNGHIKTLQYEEEWHVYKSLVDQGTPDELPWYDMRGNHDCFNVPQWDSRINMYRQFGKSAALLEEGNGVYSWALDAPFEKHQFIAMDPCPTKGIARPINFFGYVTPAIMDRLAALMFTNEKKPDYSHTFMFTHYPTTVTAVYFCGHLHRLGYGIGDVLKSFHTSTQSLELELGDMKDHGVYRILAVDHDLVSFVDVDLPRLEIDTDSTPLVPLDDNEQVIWPNSKLALAPIVLITNPKDARFALGEKEPAHRIRQSTHARFLVFSAHDPAQLKVQVFINDERLRDTPIFQGKNLWTVPWHPQELDTTGKYTFRVRVDAPDGQTTDTSVPFCLDGDRMPIRGGMGEWIISTSMASIVRLL